MAEATRVADFNRRLRFSLTPEHVLFDYGNPETSFVPWRCPRIGQERHASAEYTVTVANFVVALDSGTTSTRAVVFDHDGIPIGSAQIPHEQIFPKPGWVEHDAAELWQNASIVLDRVVAEAGLAPGDIAALGMTNQRETAIVWNVDTGIPIANAIVWPKIFEQNRAVVLGGRFIAITGRVQNEAGVIHVVAESFEDLTPMLGLLSQEGAQLSNLARADELRHPQDKGSLISNASDFYRLCHHWRRWRRRGSTRQCSDCWCY